MNKYPLRWMLYILKKYMREMVELGIDSAKAEGREEFYINNDLVRILQG